MVKVAVITGSSGGVGRALVQTYLTSGYSVIGLDKEPLKYSPERPYIGIHVNLNRFSMDVLYRDDVLEKIKLHMPSSPKSFVLINNAAEQILKSVSELEWEDWGISLGVNALAPFFLVQGLIEELKVSCGHVVNVSSVHAKLTKPEFACYAASKAALESLTRSLAIELSSLGISVNAVSPAAIATEMLKASFHSSPEKLKRLEEYHPSASIGLPDDLAKFIKAITDQKGGFLTGAVLEFTGGIAGKLHDPGY